MNVLGVPPVGTFNDLNLSISVFGVTTGFLALLVFIGLRAIVQAVLTVMVVDVLQTGSATRWSVVRSLRILPVTLAVNVACLGLLMASSFVGPLLGQGFGLLILLASLVAGVYLLGFAPAIAATERRGLADTLGRSVRAGRLPGAGNLMFAAIYVVTFVAVLAIPGKPGAHGGRQPVDRGLGGGHRGGIGPCGGPCGPGVPVPEHRRRGARSGAPAPAGGSRPPSMTLGSPDLPRC